MVLKLVLVVMAIQTAVVSTSLVSNNQTAEFSSEPAIYFLASTDDDDPHAEIRQKGIPTRKEIPTKQRTPSQQAERDRKDNYPWGNNWPPGSDKYPTPYENDDRDGDLTSSAARPLIQ